MQAEGVVNGHEFYFRARGQAWRLEIYPKGFGFVTGHGHPDTWYYEQAYPKGPFEAGFMEDQEARAFIYYAAERWARERLVD